ncbi:MAG: YfiR family protein [Acidobacteriota bacterium]
MSRDLDSHMGWLRPAWVCSRLRHVAWAAAHSLLIAWLSTAGTALARSATLEYQVKAAFLLSFVTFTEWPATAFESPSSSLRICVMGDDPFDGSLARTVQGETVAGHPVVTHHVDGGDALTDCHVLFVPRAADARAAIERSGAGAPLLTIGEADGPGRAGVIINFAIDQGQVRFDVDRTAAERRGLRLSSKLLRIARRVR